MFYPNKSIDRQKEALGFLGTAINRAQPKLNNQPAQ